MIVIHKAAMIWVGYGAGQVWFVAVSSLRPSRVRVGVGSDLPCASEQHLTRSIVIPGWKSKLTEIGQNWMQNALLYYNNWKKNGENK